MSTAIRSFLRSAICAFTICTAGQAALADNTDQSRPVQKPPAQYQPINTNPGSNPGPNSGQSSAVAPITPPLDGVPTIFATTTQQVDGYHVRRYIGVVRGVKVFQPTIGQNFRASFKGIVGGNIGAYAEMCEKARQEAYEQLMSRSAALGANAVVGLHFDSSSFSIGGSEMGTEVICYGTAVLLEANQ